MTEFNKLQYFGNLAKTGVLQVLGNAPLKVMCSLYDHSNGDGTSSRPGLENLMKETGLKKTAVTNAIRDLVEFGCIVKTGAGGRSPVTGESWAATFSLQNPPQLDDEVARTIRRRNNPPKPKKTHPLPESPVTDGGMDYRKTDSPLPENQGSTTGIPVVHYRNSTNPLPENRGSTTGLSGTYQTPYTKPSTPDHSSPAPTTPTQLHQARCRDCDRPSDTLIVGLCNGCIDDQLPSHNIAEGMNAW